MESIQECYVTACVTWMSPLQQRFPTTGTRLVLVRGTCTTGKGRSGRKVYGLYKYAQETFYFTHSGASGKQKGEITRDWLLPCR